MVKRLVLSEFILVWFSFLLNGEQQFLIKDVSNNVIIKGVATG